MGAALVLAVAFSVLRPSSLTPAAGHDGEPARQPANYAVQPQQPAVNRPAANQPSESQTTGQPPAEQPPAAAEEPDALPDDGRIHIVLDPGHGGIDPGANRGSLLEKDLNLSLSFIIREYLEELGYHVTMTREDDRTVSRPDRALHAQNVSADAFISIHHNAFDDTVTHGIETIYNDRRNAQNRTLSRYIQNELVAFTGARNRGARVNRDLVLLRQETLTMPSCIVEVGFISSTRERALLLCPEYQDKLARGIVNGIERFFSR
jgi:N-acetylmuramoyl-L-alanine amidase CwlD